MTKPQPHFKLTALILLLVFLCGMIAVSYTENKGLEPVEAKKIKKPEPLKLVKFKKGKYAPRQIKANSTHILIIGGYCTCGKSKWRRQNFLLEKTVRYTKNNKPIQKGKHYKLRISPKISFNKCGGEFTVYNPGTTTNDIDICFCGRDKCSGRGKYYMKRIR